MPRTLSPEREQEFENLLGFASFYCEAFRRKAYHSSTFAAACEKIEKEYGRSKALIGLRQAANDIIEETSRYPSEAIKIIDEALGSAGVLTLSEVRRRYQLPTSELSRAVS